MALEIKLQNNFTERKNQRKKGVVVKEFLTENSIYIVFIIVSIIWLGIFLFVNSVEKRVKSIEKEMEREENEE